MFSRLNTLFGVHVGNMDLLGLAAEQQQQQMQANQTFTPSVEEQQQLLEGISFP